MAAPKWGIFMEKVYADKKIDFPRQKDFDVPIELANDPIFADTDLSSLIDADDSLSIENGNGDAIDFMNEGYDVPVDPAVNPIDTNKPKIPTDKKDAPAGAPKAIIKTGVDDNKNKPKPKPKPDNDYK